MFKILIFFCGALTGVVTSYFLFASPHQQLTLVKTSSSELQMSKPQTKPIECQRQELANSADAATNIDQLAFNLPKVDQAKVDLLLEAFRQHEDNLYSSGEYQDLIYLVRHNQQIAQQIKNRIQESESYDERISMVAVLANNQSQATLDFAKSLIQSLEPETQGLGFDLLTAMGSHGNNPELNETLLDASLYETNPRSLSYIINQLSTTGLNAQNKDKAIDSFQRLVQQHPDATVKARAIDGLRRLGQQDTILLAVIENLNHPNEHVKTSAINAMSALDAERITPDMLESLREIVSNPQESELAKEYAATLLQNY